MSSNTQTEMGIGGDRFSVACNRVRNWPWLCAYLFGCAPAPDPAQLSSAEDAGVVSGAEHVHDHAADAGVVEDGGSSHHVRDLVAQPCTAETWRDLGIDLRECQLAGESLEGENLRHANLTYANLSAAKLTSTDLFNAKLVRADLTLSALDGASLVGADFSSANLAGASLIGADLTAAVLDGAAVEGAVTDSHTTCPDGDTGPCW